MEKVQLRTLTGQQPADVRIVLVGKTGVGKSSTGNTILGTFAFHKEASSKSVTKVCKKATNVVDGKRIEVVDTPGWCDTELSEAEIVQETVQCIDMSCPGPHVFLLVVPIGRFTEEEKKTVKKIQEVFGEGASKYMMVLFTRGDELEDRSITDYLKDAQDDLKTFVFKSCEGRYHVFNNREKNHLQVIILLQKIQNMVKQNGGSCYTNVTYQLVENYRKKESELQQKMKTIESKMQLKMEELSKTEQFMQQEREHLRLREADLHRLIKQNENQRAKDQALLERMMENLQIEQQRSQAQEQQRAAAEAARLAREREIREQEHIVYQRRMQIEEQRQQTEWENHKRRMAEEELKRGTAESQHRKRMEEERQKIEMYQQRMEKERQKIENHQQRLEEERQKIENHQQRMEVDRQKIERERVQMIKEQKENICELKRWQQQLQVEKEEQLCKELKKKKCSVS